MVFMLPTTGDPRQTASKGKASEEERWMGLSPSVICHAVDSGFAIISEMIESGQNVSYERQMSSMS